ncbi:hypothetical protein E4U43_008680 [Claviceps pusilla]|uniref:Hydrophobin 3 n=1 Tax=Claviceps pusilla TaxID=123648 RepID=A0A9P7NAT9_9HYPO|nr:hypothetical protein E4U43_008680 [Claviceps pusilla]
MKCAAVVLALAATALAVPTGSSDTVCSNDSSHTNLYCCNSGIPILGQLLCNINLGGTTCGGSAWCCTSSTAQNGLINVGLNCIQL